MIDVNKSKRAMRTRILNAAIVADEAFQREGINIDTAPLSLWVREVTISGDDDVITNIRSRCNFIIEYDVFALRNTGLGAAANIVSQIKELFSLDDNGKSTIEVSGKNWTISVYKMREESGQEGQWNRKSLLVYVSAVSGEFDNVS